MLDDGKAIAAKDIVNQPDDVFRLNRAYIMLLDTSMSNTFSNMVDAINVLHDAGWEVESMASYSYTMHVIMRNTNYKRKNSS